MPTPAAAQESPSAQALPVVVPKQGSSRYQTMAREYAEHPQGKFTVQIQILCEASNLEKAISAGGTSVWFVPQTIGTRSCYRVFWGHYETREEAQRALASVPASLRDRTSAVKPVPKAQ
jgi:septal ring-binding cell division protein DamX